MHGAHDYLTGLAQLHKLDSAEERRAVWRQGMATLARAAADQQPIPIEGVPPEPLLAAVRVALATGLVDDLAFLSKEVAAAALFELAAALPPSVEKREIGRRVIAALHEGDAATFVTLATSLALSSRRGLSGAPMRARVALSLQLPIGAGTGPDGLALALISRRELEREWLTLPATGSLPSRRLAARLIERAAREAARRAAEGDDSGLKVFERASVRGAWTRLIADRESLVWRHVATARGLLAAAAPMRGAEIDRDLAPRLSPTEWRRAAASLAASVAHDPVGALGRSRELVKSEMFKRDAGIATAMIFGITRAAEEEPEACEELLGDCVMVGGVDAIEALVDLRREHAGNEFGTRAAQMAIARLRGAPNTPDDGLVALLQALKHDLAPEPGDDGNERALQVRLHATQIAFADGQGLASATDAMLVAAQETMTHLERTKDETAEGRRDAFRALRDLDIGLLETATLGDLLTVCGRETAGSASPLGDILARLNSWILAREQQPITEANVPHFTLRSRRLRTLLHLLDVESTAADENTERARERRLQAFRVLTTRVRRDPPSALRRTLCATLARACDALVREELCELSDICVAVTWNTRTADDLRVLGEASMVPEVKEMLHAAGEVARALAGTTQSEGERSPLEAFRLVLEALPPGSSARVEGLRRAMLGMARALEALHEAQSLRDLRQSDGGTPLERLEQSVRACVQIVVGARRRLGLREHTSIVSGKGTLRALEAAVEHAMRDLGGDEQLARAAAVAIESVRADLPAVIAEVVALGLGQLARLPVEPSIQAEGAVTLASSRQLRLPPWLPPSRTLGGFYVLRPIGTGSGGSVFVARRVDERHDDSAECFALKVPSYDGAAAHTLSEEEFLQLFREEAGALLTLPRHRNLAGFVTFDVGARPKPILVMELVPGPTLERLLEKRELSAPLAFAILDGVGAGLEGMHKVGVGHLDIKPANIILRHGGEISISQLVRADQVGPTPVLVDFGLAGRKIRPGCGSPYYGAPEVWGPPSASQDTEPASADTYAYACLAFELLTGRTLFEGDTLPAIVSAHMAHDGGPETLDLLRQDARLAQVADILAGALYQDPGRRTSVRDLRSSLAGVAPTLSDHEWPLVA